MRALNAFLVVLVTVCGLLFAYVFWWFKQRYGRGGPCPFSNAGILLHPLRPLIHPVRPMLAQFGLRPGATVLELGPGIGYFSVEASRMVGPEGRLLCVDIQPPMLRALRERLEQQGTIDAHLMVGDAHNLPLADASVDTAFLVTVLGEIPDRPQALAELRRVLKPGGMLSITEHLTDPDYQLEATVRDLCRACGFAPREHQRRFLGFTMNFAALPSPTSVSAS
jgi:SAM-dependent methyltransferase